MLKSFKIKNFKSILDETISLEHTIRLPNGYKKSESIVFMENKNKERFIPLLMIFGANASGKSNLIEAVQVFKRVLRSGIESRYNFVFSKSEPISNYFPNKLNRKYNSTCFEVDFSTNENNYSYILDYNKTSILREELIQNGKQVFSIKSTADQGTRQGRLAETHFKSITQKGYGVDELLNVFEVECCFNERHMYPFLWKIVDKYPGLSGALRDAREYLSDKITGALSNNISSLYIKRLALGKEDAYEKELFTKITDIIRRLDIDISRFETTVEQKDSAKNSSENVPDKSIFLEFRDPEEKIITYHKDMDGVEVPFNFIKEESTGTRRLFGLIGMFLAALEEGRTVFIDELDASLHPFLINFLIKMFKDKKLNVNNAQLIMTTHNPYAMEESSIRVSDVAFTNKTLNLGTQVKYLYEFEGVRNTTDFVKQYLEGRLTGIPLVY